MHPNTHIFVHFIFEKKKIEIFFGFLPVITEIVPEKVHFSFPYWNDFSFPWIWFTGTITGTIGSFPY